MRRLRGGEGVEFEGEVRVSGGDEFMVHLLPGRAQMAGEASPGADIELLRIDHAGLQARLVAVGACVRTEPDLGRAVASFAGDAIGARFIGRARGVADRAALVARGVGDTEDLGHAFAAPLFQRFVGARMLVGSAPRGEFVAQNAAFGGRRCGGGSVAVGGGAAARSDVSMRGRLRPYHSTECQQNQGFFHMRTSANFSNSIFGNFISLSGQQSGRSPAVRPPRVRCTAAMDWT